MEISGVENDNYTLSIRDILGKDIFVKAINVNGFIKAAIDLSAYSKGTYLLNIQNSKSMITRKLLIE